MASYPDTANGLQTITYFLNTIPISSSPAHSSYFLPLPTCKSDMNISPQN